MKTEERSELSESELLATLVGQTLEHVVFIQNYLMLNFASISITLITPPVLIAEGARYPWGTPDFCFRMVGCIGQKAVSSVMEEDVAYRIRLESGVEVEVSLREEDYRAAEAFVYKRVRWKGVDTLTKKKAGGKLSR